MPEGSRHGGNQGAAGLPGAIWVIGWLFTAAYTGLVWWKFLLALIIWPYYLGVALR